MKKTTHFEKDLLTQLERKIRFIHRKEDFLEAFRLCMKDVFEGFSVVINLYNDHSEYFSPYWICGNEKLIKDKKFAEILNTEFTIEDSYLNSVFYERGFIITDFVDTYDTDNVNNLRDANERLRLREFLLVPISLKKQKLGIITLISQEKSAFTEGHIKFLKLIAQQISITLSNILAWETVERNDRENEILLHTSEAISHVRNRKDLLDVIQEHLRTLFKFDDLAIGINDAESGQQRFLLVDVRKRTDEPPDATRRISRSHPTPDGFFEVYSKAADLILFDVEKLNEQIRLPDYIRLGMDAGVKEFIAVPLRDSSRDLGIMYLTSDSKNAFKKNHLHLVQNMAPQISTAVANVLINETAEKRENEKRLLLGLSNALITVKDEKATEQIIRDFFEENLNDAEFLICVKNENGRGFRHFADGLKTKKDTGKPVKYVIDASLCNEVFRSNELIKVEQPVRFEIGNFTAEVVSINQLDAESRFTGFCLNVANENLGVLWMPANLSDVDFLAGIGNQIAIAVANVLANVKVSAQLEEIKKYKDQLEAENRYLQEEVYVKPNSNNMTGTGQDIQEVFKLISEVAYTNSTVLILGETGTGKELAARAIHEESARSTRIMVKVNCAALPASLIESELFGHEKGSFTGATEQRIGKFELADKSTLFLDEVGELPPDLQVKLLRVLQEMEVDRIGGKTPVKINVRIIAATNRDLLKEIKEGRFRSDLYYRLNVFPIGLPPLRKRKEDIPSLAALFMEKFSKENGKKITAISPKVIKEFMAYNWPGNIRELEHLIERSVLLTKGNIIKQVSLPKEKQVLKDEPSGLLKTLKDAEKDHIIRALKKCGGKRFGHGGAAELLGVNISTLNSIIRKLGITKENIYS